MYVCMYVCNVTSAGLQQLHHPHVVSQSLPELDGQVLPINLSVYAFCFIELVQVHRRLCIEIRRPDREGEGRGDSLSKFDVANLP